MAIPPGVQVKTLIVSPARNANANPVESSVEVVVEPIMPPNVSGQAVWEATSEPLVSFFRVIRTPPTIAAVIDLPTTDQPGFVDNRLAPLKDWHYKVTARYLIDGRKVGLRTVKLIMPRSSDPDYLDFDLIPSSDTPLYSGPTGREGPRGQSAYEVAVEDGFEGSEEDWVQSLRGDQGDPGYLTIFEGLPVGRTPPPSPTYGSLWVPL